MVFLTLNEHLALLFKISNFYRFYTGDIVASTSMKIKTVLKVLQSFNFHVQKFIKDCPFRTVCTSILRAHLNILFSYLT